MLVFGATGIGKSILAAGIVQTLERSGHRCGLISADPGSPPFGIPGAICLAYHGKTGWKINAFEALCSLDAGRFRLPLVDAVRKLASNVSGDMLLVDPPGVVRGVAGAELLTTLVATAAIDTILVLAPEGKGPPLASELKIAGTELFLVRPSAGARQPGKNQRRRHRTTLWDAYLQHGVISKINLDGIAVTGTPPPEDALEEWRGRQVALLRGKQTLAMGEVVSRDRDCIRLRLPQFQGKAQQILVRDARRDTRGWLTTAEPFGAKTLRYLPPPDIRPYTHGLNNTGYSPVVHVGTATAILVNGIFGDPLLHLRLGNRRQSLLFDIGEGYRLPARIAHQVTDVCISHAHFDHISGFLWLMRSRIGTLPPCRIFGPAGLFDHIFGLMKGILWDRIGSQGPSFEVSELHGEELRTYHLQAGSACSMKYEKRPAPGGILLREPTFQLRATVLDHGTPSLAYCFEHTPELNIRKNRLAAKGLAAGPWLRDLKQRIVAGDLAALIHLPDGTSGLAAELANELLRVSPPQKLIYETDFADTPANRQQLIALALDASVLFCEAPFIEADREQAMSTGHLTARACGEIAAAAGVQYLVPFHLSHRYERYPRCVYREIKSAFSRVITPPYPSTSSEHR